MQSGMQKIGKRSTQWSEPYWRQLETEIRHLAITSGSDAAAWRVIVRQARYVMRAFTTSFFIVTRFLPPAKRERVETVYAAVRYPDEIVDTFPLSSAQQFRMLDEWAKAYETGLATTSVKEALDNNVPCFLSTFSSVVQETAMPQEFYRAFLQAMRHDASPRRFATLDDLIDNYIYGSAIVVGYFLTYIYGENQRGDFERAIRS